MKHSGEAEVPSCKDTVVSSFHMHCYSKKRLRRKFPWDVSVKSAFSLYPACSLALQQNVPSRVSLLGCWRLEGRTMLKTFLYLSGLWATCTCAQHMDGNGTVCPEHLQPRLPIPASVSLYLPFSFSLCLQAVLVSAHRLCKALLLFLLQHSV